MNSISRYRHSNLISLLAVLALCLIALARVSSAQSPDKIVKQAAKALGGDKNLRRINSWQASGTIVRQSDGAKGSYQMSMTKPDLYSLSIDISGFETGEGFNGKSGWRRDSRAGLRTLIGVEANQFRAE